MLRVALLASLLIGCGGEDSSAPAASSDASTTDAETSVQDAGTVTQCWTDKLGDLFDYAVAIQIHPSGDIIVEGVFQGDVDLGGTKLTAPTVDGGSSYSSFVARLRKSDGTAVWARMVGDAAQVRFWGALALDPTGNVVVGGSFTGTATDLAGITAPDPMGGGFVARLDGETGKTSVAKALDVSVGPRFLARASDGSYVASGYYSDYARLGPTPLKTTASTDVWVARLSLDDATTVRWAARVGDGGSDSIRGIGLTSTDDVLVAANLRSSGSITDNVYVAKLAAASGAVAWEKSYSGDKSIETRALVSIGDEVAVLGVMHSATAIGGDPIPVDKGKETIWLGRWAIADGAPRGSARVVSSSSNDDEPNVIGATKSGELWFMSLSGLHVIAPSTGSEIVRIKPGAGGAGDYDPAIARWYSGSQGSISCHEAH